MKFKCGFTNAEILANREAAYEEVKRLQQWHRVFAWRPIEVAKGDCRWLEWIERRYPTGESAPWFYSHETNPRIRKYNPEYRSIT